MKKKFLLMLAMVAFAVCLFAISVSAASVNVGGIYYTLNGSGENATAEVNGDNINCTVVDVVIPETITVSAEHTDNASLHGTYTVTSIKDRAFAGSGFGANQTIKSIEIPKTVTYIGGHFLRKCSVERVTIKASITDLTNAQFYDCSNLVYVDMSESTIENIAIAFTNCSSLTTIKFPPKLKSITNQAFFGCSSIVSLDFTDFPLEEIGGKVFQNCSNLESIKLPGTFKRFGSTNAIQQTRITTIVFPPSLEKLVNTSLPQNYSLYLVVFPAIDENDTDIASDPFYGNSGKPEVVLYAGTNYEYVTGTGKIFAGYNVLPYESYDPAVTYTTKTLFYGAPTCATCGGIMETQESFKFVDLITDMKVSKACTHCGLESVTQNYGSVIVDLGYSVFENNGYCSILQSFMINNSAVVEFNKRFADAKISSFGVLAASASSVVDGKAFDAEGNAYDKVVTHDNFEHNYIIIKVTNMPLDGKLANGTAFVDAKLYMSAYVTVGDEIYYVSEGHAGTVLGEAVSYNDKKTDEE